MTENRPPVDLERVMRNVDEAQLALRNAHLGSPLSYVLTSAEDVVPLVEEVRKLRAELAEARLLQSPFPDQSARMGDREIEERKPRSVDEPIPQLRTGQIWANVNTLARDVTRVTGNPEREDTYISSLPELRGITARQPESGAPMAFTLIDGTQFVWAAGNLPWSIKKGTRPNV